MTQVVRLRLLVYANEVKKSGTSGAKESLVASDSVVPDAPSSTITNQMVPGRRLGIPLTITNWLAPGQWVAAQWLLLW